MLPSMDRSIRILSVFLLLTFASVASAQTPPACGIVGIDGPDTVDQGETLRFKVRTTGLNTKPEFKWTVSAGTIMGGQGTDQISVDTAGIGGQDVTTTVELSGAMPGCNASASTTTRIAPPAFSCCHRFDEYGDLRFEDEKARLENFAIQISQLPLSSGSLLMYAGQETFKNEAAERLARAKSYLVKVRNIDPGRIITVDCGFTTDLTITLHIVPAGSRFPPCYNPVEIPITKVKFTKRRPKASKRRH
jgi:hypothetical protein